MEQVPRLTLLEVIHFLVEPLNCDVNPTAHKLLAAVAARGQWPTVPWGQPFLMATCRLSCDFRARPALLLSLVALVCTVLVITLRNAFVNLLRWYAAARGSAFVAVATRALRELHASGAYFPASTSTSGGPATTAASGAGGGSGARGPGSAVGLPRPTAAHRWYTLQTVTAPVVCCGCFQPVVMAQGGEGEAQCCELCGMVAHGSCAKAVPHNCRLLSLAPPPAASPPPATARAGNGAVATPPPPPPPPPPPLPHDWRPAGTTLDLILPPADAEMLLGGNSPPTAGLGLGVSGSSAPCYSHGPSSLCLYCGEPCEVGLLAVEPVWRCGGCRRFTHVQCWSSLHPGVLSAATRAALQGQALEAEEISGSPRGTSFQWEVADGDNGGGDGPLVTPPSGSPPPGGDPPPPAAAAAEVPPPARARSGGGSTAAGEGGSATATAGGKTSAAARHSSRPLNPGGKGPSTGHGAPATAAAAADGSVWDRNRRCQSVPNIAGGAANGNPNHQQQQQSHHHQPAGGQRVPNGVAEGSAAAAADGAAGGGAAGSGSSGGDSGRQEGSTAVAPRWPGDSGRLHRLDRCDPLGSLAALGAMVLLPTAVLPVNGRSTSSAGKLVSAALARATTTSVTTTPSAATSGGRGRKKQQQQQPAGRSLRQQAQKWYRSHAAGWSLGSAGAGAGGDPVGPDRWRHFRIGPLSPGCKPVLVFINPRSGPQVGEHLRHQLLQLLHPMQVVDLSRETPTAALRCWWGVPGLRVLVVGGDGTAGWVLGEMEAVAAELAAVAAAAAAAAAPQSNGGHGAEPNGTSTTATGASSAAAPPPPAGSGRPAAVAPPAPLAVLPMGTGNDLARVLGWGGGLAALDARGGVAAVLAEVATAAPTPLDRWALSIAITPPEPSKRRSSFLPRRRQPAAVATARSQPPAVVQVKTFNNYLGVGIDSWCALEFHRMRERYPGWFKSQLGNKMWYTGVGARDLLARSCVDLPSRLQLLCDGVPVELPPSTQGILLLNIPSYMGGVDLWGNGVTQQQLQLGLQHNLHSAATAPAALREAPAAAAAPGGAAGAAGGGGSGGGFSASGGGSSQGVAPEHHSPERPTGSRGAALGGGTNPGAPPPVGSSGRLARRGGGGGGGGGGASPPGPTTTGDRSASDASHLHPPPPQAQPSQLQLQQPPPPPPQQQQQQQQSHPSTMALHPEVPQSISDGVLEVVVVYGAVHLGQLQVGLARATRLCQCRTAVITTHQALPMQVDGEPWMQPAAQLTVSLKGSALLLRRLDLSSATSRLTAVVGEVLDGAVARGTISAVQRATLGAELAQRLGAPHAV